METHNILKLLIGTKQKFSIRKLSQLREINYKSAYNAVMKLAQQKLITLEKLGNTNLCSFNNHFNPLVFAVEYERRADLIKDKNFKVLYSTLKEIQLSFITLLFGSFAKKTTTKHSDIDLLIISEKNTEIEQVLLLIPLEIHPTIISHKDFIAMAKSREFSVVSEAMKKNVILKGIEDYYQLLENVGCKKKE